MSAFSQSYIDFFEELAGNNHKQWFDENRKRYKSVVREPFEAFVDAVIKRVGEHDERVKLPVKDSLFRINRDIRFSKDKRPYKSHMAAVISRSGRRDMQVPGIYIQAGAGQMMIAGGLYQPDRDQLIAVRRGLVEKPGQLEKLLEGKKFKEYFGGLRGDRNKILPAEFKEHAAAIPLLYQKQFFYSAEYPDPSVMLKTDIVDFVMEHYLAAEPVMQWLDGAVYG